MMNFSEWLLLEKKHVPCAGIFFTDGQSVLLLKRSEDSSNPRTWALPGGHSKEGESPQKNAERECKEEIGCVKGKKFGQLVQDGWWTCFFYKVDKLFDVKMSKEHTNWAWIKFDELNDYDLHPEFKKQIKKYIGYVKTNNRCKSKN